MIPAYRVLTAVEEPDLLALTDSFVEDVWPAFMLNDPVANQYWARLYTEFPQYQFAFKDEEKNLIFTAGNCIPIRFDGELNDLPEAGWDWAVKKGFEDREKGREPNVLCALSITIRPQYQGMRISPEMVMTMKGIGQQQKLDPFIAPVRPNRKHLYPLISIDDYIRWENDAGLPFDAWLRVHHRLGASIIKPCHEAMFIPGTIEDWQNWTGMDFPDTGEYVVPGALNPIHMDVTADRGEYTEPNVWMVHSLE